MAAVKKEKPAKSPKTKKKQDRRFFVPTDADRNLVRILSGYGIPKADIASSIRRGKHGIGLDTLYKYFGDEMSEGDAQAKGKIGEALFRSAMNGNVTAQIFLAKIRLGWSERVHLQHTGAPSDVASGGFEPIKIEIVKTSKGNPYEKNSD